MRVAFVTHYTSLYGANRALLDLIDGLRDHGVTSCVLAPRAGDLIEELRRRGTPYAVLPFADWRTPGTSRIRALDRLRRNVSVLPAVRRQLRAWRVDVVYSNSSITPIGALAAWSVRRPHVWHVREFGDLDYGFTDDWGPTFFRRCLSSAAARVAVSRAVRDHIRARDPVLDFRVIYSGVASAERFQQLYCAARDQRRDGPFTFALVGLIHPTKGQESAIRALALLSGRSAARLRIVGGGRPDYIDRCGRLVCELNLTDRVEFWGEVRDPFRALLASDAALMCSCNEGMGRVTVEGMAACRPVIGFASGGTCELIAHERTGLLYHGGPVALAACMERLMLDPAWARELGENGWHAARAVFTREECARQVDGILRSLASE